MAQVTTSTQQHIDILLCGLLEKWNDLPNVVATIDEWDVVDQIVYVEEWPVVEQRLKMLTEYAAEGVLSPDQRNRYDALLQLIQRHRPLVARLYEE